MLKEYILLREIKRLKSVRGNGTELISLYVPAGFQISDVIAKLRSEYNTSSNIKSKTTRTNVQAALEKIMQYLKLFKETPKNGLVVFCGNISDNPGKTDIELFSLEPPQQLKMNIYRCDSTFLLDPLEDMVSNRAMYILVVLDGREATVATLKGTHVEIIKKLNSLAHAKVHKGGQSARRYERLIEEDINDYYKRIADVINNLYLQSVIKPKGVIVGGPGPTKENFVKANYINYQIKILGVFDTGYTDEYGLQELIEKAKDLLKEEESAIERKYVDIFIREIARNSGLAVQGYDNVKSALMSGKVSKLLISLDIELYKVTYSCDLCKATIEKIELGNKRTEIHEGCGGHLSVVKEEDAIEELIKLADENKVEVIFISSESSYGKEFLQGFGGIGAILRG